MKSLNAWNFYLLVHLLADAEQHQHVVALCDAHRVEVTEHVGARDPALEEQTGGRLKQAESLGRSNVSEDESCDSYPMDR